MADLTQGDAQRDHMALQRTQRHGKDHNKAKWSDCETCKRLIRQRGDTVDGKKP